VRRSKRPLITDFTGCFISGERIIPDGSRESCRGLEKTAVVIEGRRRPGDRPRQKSESPGTEAAFGAPLVSGRRPPEMASVACLRFSNSAMFRALIAFAWADTVKANGTHTSSTSVDAAEMLRGPAVGSVRAA